MPAKYKAFFTILGVITAIYLVVVYFLPVFFTIIEFLFSIGLYLLAIGAIIFFILYMVGVFVRKNDRNSID